MPSRDVTAVSLISSSLRHAQDVMRNLARDLELHDSFNGTFLSSTASREPTPDKLQTGKSRSCAHASRDGLAPLRACAPTDPVSWGGTRRNPFSCTLVAWQVT